MSGLRLTLREPVRLPVDGSPIGPDRLAGLSPHEVEAVEVRIGNARQRLGDLFAVGVTEDDGLTIEGDFSAFAKLGAGMTNGSLRIEGDAGAWLGLGMKGGRLDVTGSVGPAAGAMMRGGLLLVAGDAGEQLGGPLPGERRGMKGGVIVVRGHAGDRPGERMRRGTIVIEGDAGACAGANMIGGTVVVLGTPGPWPGFGLRRGTLLLQAAPGRLLPTFEDCGVHSLSWLGLFDRHLRDFGIDLPLPGTGGARVRRLAGDLAELGKGELLLAAA